MPLTDLSELDSEQRKRIENLSNQPKYWVPAEKKSK